jgi:hypothetical protein
LGRALRDKGQKRVPLPPARINACIRKSSSGAFFHVHTDAGVYLSILERPGGDPLFPPRDTMATVSDLIFDV